MCLASQQDVQLPDSALLLAQGKGSHVDHVTNFSYYRTTNV